MFHTYIEQLIKENEIPAAVLTIEKNQETIVSESYGSYKDNENNKIEASTNTIFDLASLTKVMATLPSILLLLERKALSLEDKVKTFIPTFKNTQVSILQLLQHTSGLPADLPYINRKVQRDVFQAALDSNLINDPGSKVIYSDLGMILLGKLIEKVSGMRLEYFTKKELYDPWKMRDTEFLPSKEKLSRIAATEKFQGKYIHGEVHDEKAYQLGGVSGSAGLFSTAKDVSTFANYWLFPENQSVLSKQSMDLVHKNIVENRGLGFEIWSGFGEELSCGRRWSKGSFGHTGFTGTSLWIDPMEKLSVVFLTNVVHYGREHRLQEVRKKLHTMVYKELI